MIIIQQRRRLAFSLRIFVGRVSATQYPIFAILFSIRSLTAVVILLRRWKRSFIKGFSQRPSRVYLVCSRLWRRRTSNRYVVAQCIPIDIRLWNVQVASLDTIEASRIQRHLLKAFAIWRPSYDIQERFQVLQAFLGLREYKRIVPDAFDPIIQITGLEIINGDSTSDRDPARATRQLLFQPSPLSPSALTAAISNEAGMPIDSSFG